MRQKSRKSIAFCKFIEILQANQMFTKRFMHFLTKHNKNSNNYHQIKQLQASYEIHNLFNHSLKATYAKLSRERSEVTKCIGVQVSQLIYSRTRRPMILKLGMKHQAIELYKVYINRDPWMTLTYFTARST